MKWITKLSKMMTVNIVCVCVYVRRSDALRRSNTSTRACLWRSVMAYTKAVRKFHSLLTHFHLRFHKLINPYAGCPKSSPHAYSKGHKQQATTTKIKEQACEA